MVKIRIFNSLKLFSSAEDKFCGRTTRGANDAVNSALNYGYAILYGRAQKA